MFLFRSFSSSSFLLTSYSRLSKSVSLQTLFKRGFTPTLQSINKFLIFLSRTQRFNSIIHFISQMNSNQIKGNSQTHSIFTWALLKLHKFEEAEDFMNSQMGKTSFSPNSRLFDLLIQGFCVKRNNPERALLVLKSCLRNYGTFPCSFTFCSLIYSFSYLGYMNRAVEVLELMTDQNVKYPFDNFVCSSVISGFCKIGKPELAIGFFENATGLGALRPNVVSFTALLSALCMLGRVNEVNDLVIRMENEGLIFDVIFYSSWIYGCLRDGSLLEALRKHRQMIERGIKMDVISYTILIDGFSKEGQVEKAVGILNKMIKDGLRPNLITYTAIILGFCKKGKLEEAFNVFKKVEDIGIVADEFIYATLIDGVCRRGDLDYAFHLLEEMERKGIKPTIVTYNTIINGLCKVGRTSEADEVSKGILGDVVTYSTLLHALFMVGALEDAHALYQAMSEMDLVANSVTYCTMIDGYCKLGRIEEALEIFDEFRGRNRGIAPNIVTYNSLMNTLCRQGCLVEAFRLFDSLEKIHLAPSEVTYATLIDNLCKEGFLLDAKQLLERMVLKGFNPSTRIYNFLIDGYCKLGRMEEASKFLHDLETTCLKPDEFTVSSVINGFCLKGDMEGALGQFFKFKRQGILPDFLGFLYLIRGLCTKGRMEESRSILREMLQSKTVLELINGVDSEVESESVVSLLFSLCEQGSIREAISILDEIGSILFPVRSFSTDYGSRTSNKLYECEAFTSSSKQNDSEMVENSYNVGKISQSLDFDFCYSQIASLCSKGELQKANGVLKEMLSRSNTDS
ncbi:hypothetical protein Pint_14038 [Pistacia integerrima]|uniref:Uncharacterized protein n=1 Tax=Pistacia integerrima TaxID=434235 RepID=A0ACC0Y5H5_9ROSI|nr:hypothetical protein Pint_14038 [Pistacia integerrima]